MDCSVGSKYFVCSIEFNIPKWQSLFMNMLSKLLPMAQSAFDRIAELKGALEADGTDQMS